MASPFATLLATLRTALEAHTTDESPTIAFVAIDGLLDPSREPLTSARVFGVTPTGAPTRTAQMGASLIQYQRGFDVVVTYDTLGDTADVGAILADDADRIVALAENPQTWGTIDGLDNVEGTGTGDTGFDPNHRVVQTLSFVATYTRNLASTGVIDGGSASGSSYGEIDGGGA